MSLALAFLSSGPADAPPLIVMHGLFGSARNWNTVMRRIGGRHVLALDLRNHGASPWADSMTYPEMAADLRRFLDDRGIGRAAVLGHSMGGKVAMTLALESPERVERLIVADIAPVTYTHTHQPYVEAMAAIDLSRVTRRAEVEEQLAATVPEPGLRAFLTQNLVAEDGGFRWRINLDAIGRSMETLTGFPALDGRRYDGPTLFIAGANSDYIRPQHDPTIRALFPAARVKSIPDAGHWVHAEKPDAFVQAVTAFL